MDLWVIGVVCRGLECPLRATISFIVLHRDRETSMLPALLCIPLRGNVHAFPTSPLHLLCCFCLGLRQGTMRMWKPAWQKCLLRLSLIICPLLVCSWVTECWGRGSRAHLPLGAQQVVRAVLEHCCSATRQDVSHLHISQTSSTPPRWRITSLTAGKKPSLSCLWIS